MKRGKKNLLSKSAILVLLLSLLNGHLIESGRSSDIRLMDDLFSFVKLLLSVGSTRKIRGTDHEEKLAYEAVSSVLG